MDLSNDEIAVLRAWPEFQERLKTLRTDRERKKEQEEQKHSEWLSRIWPLCQGGSYTARAGTISCSKCGVTYTALSKAGYQKFAQLFSAGYLFHWYHEDGGSPWRKDGRWDLPPDQDPLGTRYQDLRDEEEAATVEP